VRISVATIVIMMACRDPAPPAITGAVNVAYAAEVDALCNLESAAPPKTEKTVARVEDPIAFLRAEDALVKEARTRSLIARLLADQPKKRGEILRGELLGQAKPLLPAMQGPDPSAPTAPWGREDPKPRAWTCPLADKLDALAK
jgi:hypothetical protein